MKNKYILYKHKEGKKTYNFINGNDWICVEIKKDLARFYHKSKGIQIVVRNARFCYPYYGKVENQESNHSPKKTGDQKWE